MRSQLLAGALLLTCPVMALAQSPAPAPPVSDSGAHGAAPDSARAAPTAPTALLTALAGLTLSGYAEASYAVSDHPNGGTITGRLYDRFQNQFSLDAVKLVLDKPYDATKRATSSSTSRTSPTWA